MGVEEQPDSTESQTPTYDECLDDAEQACDGGIDSFTYSDGTCSFTCKELAVFPEAERFKKVLKYDGIQ